MTAQQMQTTQQIPSLETARLRLRPFTLDDLSALHQILNGDSVLRYFPNPEPPSLERVEKIIRHQLDHWHRYRYGWWAVELRASKVLAGWCGLQFLPETRETEVGYLLGLSFWGQGLATEGAQASLRYGFDTLALKQIIGLVHPDNIASQRVLEKSGLSYVEEACYFGMICYRYLIECSKQAQGIPSS